MNRIPFSKSVGTMSGWGRQREAGSARRPVGAAPTLEALEGRIVLSAAPTTLSNAMLTGTYMIGGLPTLGGAAPPTLGGGAKILTSDASHTDKAFDKFAATIQASVATFRQTGSATAAPTAAGLAAFDSAVASATTDLNSAISTILKNLPKTEAALLQTINGYTATLQSEVQSAGTGLSNASNSAVLAMNNEITSYEKTAQHQTSLTIRNDLPTGTIAGSKAKALNQAVSNAVQNFNLAINTVEVQAIAQNVTPTSTTIASAVSNLSNSLTSAVAALPPAFTASSFNPTSLLKSELSTLQSDLTAILTPTSSQTSVFTLNFTCGLVMSVDGMAIDQTLFQAIDSYDQSLL